MAKQSKGNLQSLSTDALHHEGDSVDLVFSEVKAAIQTQLSQKETHETKANALIGFAGVVYALLIGQLPTFSNIIRESQYIMVFSIGLFSISVLMCIYVSWVRFYRADPRPDVLANHYLAFPEKKTKLQITSNLIGCWKENQKFIERNGKFLRVAFLLQSIAFLLLGISLLITFR